MRNLFILLMAIICFSSFGQHADMKISESSASSTKPILKRVNFAELQTILNKKDNKLYVVNFWATWCKPCVEELPGFMEVNKSYCSNPHFKMIMVSLDFAKEMESGVRPFLLKNKIDTDVYLLDDNKRMNVWIPVIDKKWSGAIPATVFYRNGKKLKFIENKIDKNELQKIIHQYL